MKKTSRVYAIYVAMAMLLIISGCKYSVQPEQDSIVRDNGIEGETEPNREATQDTSDELIVPMDTIPRESNQTETTISETVATETKEENFEPTERFPAAGESVELPDIPVEWEEESSEPTSAHELEDNSTTTEKTEDNEKPVSPETEPTTEGMETNTTENGNIRSEEVNGTDKETPDSPFDGDW